MKKILFLLLALGYSISGAHAQSGQDRICMGINGEYFVNTANQNTFSVDYSDYTTEIDQVIKKGNFLYYVLIAHKLAPRKDGNDQRIELYEYNCMRASTKTLSSVGYIGPNGIQFDGKIEAMDGRFMVVRSTNSYNQLYDYEYYDRVQKVTISSTTATSALGNFHSIKAFRQLRLGVGQVLIRSTDGSEKWMRYNLLKRRIY